MGYQTTRTTSEKINLDFATGKTVNWGRGWAGRGSGNCRALQSHGECAGGRGNRRNKMGHRLKKKGIKVPVTCQMRLGSDLALAEPCA